MLAPTPVPPVPLVTARVTLLVSVVALPKASRMTTTGWVVNAMPGAAPLDGEVVKASTAGAAAVMLNVLVTAEVRPALDAVSL